MFTKKLSPKDFPLIQVFSCQKPALWGSSSRLTCRWNSPLSPCCSRFLWKLGNNKSLKGIFLFKSKTLVNMWGAVDKIPKVIMYKAIVQLCKAAAPWDQENHRANHWVRGMSHPFLSHVTKDTFSMGTDEKSNSLSLAQFRLWTHSYKEQGFY